MILNLQVLTNTDTAKPPPSPAPKKLSLAESIQQITKVSAEENERKNEAPLQQNHDVFISRNQQLESKNKLNDGLLNDTNFKSRSPVREVNTSHF